MPASHSPRAGWLARHGAALVANLAILVVALWAWWLEAADADAYYLAVQEDETLEWATVWAFAGAAVLFAVAAVRQRRAGRRWPWFAAGLALFCLFVAGEEISWGQRLLGYRPPDYFLEHNFQQEFNFHNVVDTSLRKLALKGVLAGYGVLLPLAALWTPVRRRLGALGIFAPPAALVPSFAAALWIYESYPWRFSGELVELMMGGGFLFAAMAAPPSADEAPGFRVRWWPVVASALVVVVLGLATAVPLRARRDAHPANLEAAAAETEALRRDFLGLAQRNRGRLVTRCGLHKRLYTFVEQYEVEGLDQGQFARLTAQGLPEARARFFLDPWNSPYWIRDRCDRDDDRRRVFVYSFGPNRRRDSTPWEIGGDDVGAMIFREGS